MRILGIETSCDECSVSVIEGFSPPSIKSVVTFSQIEIHQPYGGVVPEIASRNHLETLPSLIDKALIEAQLTAQQLDAIAVTQRPGLIGALLVGVSAAKAMAYALDKPLIPVHHLEGHAASIFLNPQTHQIPLPYLLAIISGGHTQLYVVRTPPTEWPITFLQDSLVGRSRDDAAGEAFDKTAKILGLPYPGGIWIDQLSQQGNPHAYTLPRALPQKSTLDYSFSGLKTAAATLVAQLQQQGPLEPILADLCASIQEAIIDALWNKMALAIERYQCRGLAIVGGVAANSRLRNRLNLEWKKIGLDAPAFFPPKEFCTDNAAMIALAGAYRFQQGHFLRKDAFLTLNASAQSEAVPTKRGSDSNLR